MKTLILAAAVVASMFVVPAASAAAQSRRSIPLTATCFAFRMPNNVLINCLGDNGVLRGKKWHYYAANFFWYKRGAWWRLTDHGKATVHCRVVVSGNIDSFKNINIAECHR